MRIFVHVRGDDLWHRIADAAARIDAEIVDARSMTPEAIGHALRGDGDVALVETDVGDAIDSLRADADRMDAALVLACPAADDCPPRLLARADDWVAADVGAAELALRVRTAAERASARAPWNRMIDAADLFRYEELLFDKRTRLPNVPLVLAQMRDRLQRRDELTIVYIHFAWFSKIEETFGWQRFDDVLETTADALRAFFVRAHEGVEHEPVLAFAADDDFVVFDDASPGTEQADRRLGAMSRRLEAAVVDRLREAHGDEIADLGGAYVGTARVSRNPKVSTDRLIQRALREAAQAARSAEEWQRADRITELEATLREGAVFMEYHPIILVATEEVYGYEALARGERSELRSPEVLFEIADEANLVWELSRLLRRRAVEGIIDRLEPDQLLFLNVDPHDFDDPAFRDFDAEALGIDDPGRIVLEITERIAIRDYPRFQTYLAAFRERGFRFAVDDAGSGYAGLGSIANLAPDFIKLDISLISEIDANFLKQNLVQTLVQFAEEHGAQVIAEGVETRAEFETVRRIGVHLAQGFYFDRSIEAGRARTA